jgi:hypothetical protein
VESARLSNLFAGTHDVIARMTADRVKVTGIVYLQPSVSDLQFLGATSRCARSNLIAVGNTDPYKESERVLRL